KTMLPSVPASLMTMDAAFVGFGAIRAIAETARHVDIKRFILLPPLQLPAGSPALNSVGFPAWLTVEQDACHLRITEKYQLATPSGGGSGGIKAAAQPWRVKNRDAKHIPLHQATGKGLPRCSGIR